MTEDLEAPPRTDGLPEAAAASARPESLPERIVAPLSRLGGAVSGILILGVLALTAVSVFNRYALNRPVMGTDEATGFLVVAIVMLGAAEALRRGDHIRIDILFDHLGPRAHRWLDVWSLCAVLLFAVLLMIKGWETVAFTRMFGAYSTGYLAMPLWIPQLALVIGAILLGLVSLALLAGLLWRSRP